MTERPTWADLTAADFCPLCTGFYCEPTCPRYVKPPPIEESVAGIRELQAASKPHYAIRHLAADRWSADRVVCVSCHTTWPCREAS
jgi:hypothetical protein